MRRALVPALLAPALALAVAACSSSGSSQATTTAATTASSPPTTATAASTSAPTSAPAPTTTTAAGSATTESATTVANPSPGTTVAATAAAKATVVSYLTSLQLAVTDPEATCLAGRLDPATLESMQDAVTNGSEATDEAATDLLEALAVCQPKSYVDSQVAVITQGAPAATQAQAECVVRNANHAFATDADLLALASGDESTQDWPAPQLAKLRAAIAPCAPSALIDQIISTI